VHRVIDALNEQAKAVKGSRVLILGPAYEPDVYDERESLSDTLMTLLSNIIDELRDGTDIYCFFLARMTEASPHV
jgi:UDP-N-acetyl-D-mannosaminuronate dehydrogenase